MAENIALQEVKEKMEEVEAILSYLAENHHFNYVLQYTLTDRNGYTVHLQDMLFNEHLAPENVLYFSQLLEDFYDELQVVPDAVRAGRIAVECLDDSNPPAGIGDWPKMNAVYFVKSIRPTLQKGVYCYALEGMKPNPPFEGYNSKRFRVVMDIRENLN